MPVRLDAHDDRVETRKLPDWGLLGFARKGARHCPYDLVLSSCRTGIRKSKLMLDPIESKEKTESKRESSGSFQRDGLERILCALSFLLGIGVPLGILWHFTQGDPLHLVVRPYLLPLNHLVQMVSLLIGAISLIGSGICLLRTFGGVRLRRTGIIVVGITTVLFCILLPGVSPGLLVPESDMTHSGFQDADTSITTGMSLTFTNPSDGSTQVLCIGSHQECHPIPGSPPQLNSGLHLLPGQSAGVIFKTSGDYPVTSKTTPNMNTIVHVVNPPPPDNNVD